LEGHFQLVEASCVEFCVALETDCLINGNT
jgi:hypothetical protein